MNRYTMSKAAAQRVMERLGGCMTYASVKAALRSEGFVGMTPLSDMVPFLEGDDLRRVARAVAYYAEDMERARTNLRYAVERMLDVEFDRGEI